jgi:hypothetical protein
VALSLLLTSALLFWTACIDSKGLLREHAVVERAEFTENESHQIARTNLITLSNIPWSVRTTASRKMITSHDLNYVLLSIIQSDIDLFVKVLGQRPLYLHVVLGKVNIRKYITSTFNVPIKLKAYIIIIKHIIIFSL